MMQHLEHEPSPECIVQGRASAFRSLHTKSGLHSPPATPVTPAAG